MITKRYVANVHTPVGAFGVVGTEDGVTDILLPFEKVRASAGPAPTPVAKGAQQLDEYFQGLRRTFDLQLVEVEATTFQHDVWAALVAIPYGEVRTYAEIATAVHRPHASRAVGNANHANRWPVVVPCHRVIGANGGLGGYGGGVEVKRFLLELEGVHLR